MSRELQLENARLREALSQIGGFSAAWRKSYAGSGDSHINSVSVIDKLNAIETTAKAALNNGEST